MSTTTYGRREGELDPPPDWVAEQDGGAGFAEIAEHILALRGST
jgi:hypothetical protein